MSATMNAREFTLYRSEKKQYKNHAPHVIDEVFKFAQQAMGTEHVKIQSALVKHIWLTGIDNPPIHLRLSRRRIGDPNNDYKTCAFVELVGKGAIKKKKKTMKMMKQAETNKAP